MCWCRDGYYFHREGVALAKIKSYAKQFNRKVRRKLNAGLAASVEELADCYQVNLSQQFSPPTSNPGEYPHVDTGQSIQNVAFEHDPKELKARAGMMGDQGIGEDGVGGLGPIFLELGIGYGNEGKEWKGLVASYNECKDDMAKKFQEASDSTE